MTQIKQIIASANDLNKLIEHQFYLLKDKSEELNGDLTELLAVDTDVISTIQKQKLKEAAEHMQKARAALNVATERYTVQASRPLLTAVA